MKYDQGNQRKTPDILRLEKWDSFYMIHFYLFYPIYKSEAKSFLKKHKLILSKGMSLNSKLCLQVHR